MNPVPADTDHHVSATVESAQAGAAVARDLFRTELDVETKAEKTDVVTRADRATQRAIVEHVSSSFRHRPRRRRSRV